MKHRNSRMLLSLGIGRGPARRDDTSTDDKTDGGGSGKTDDAKTGEPKKPEIKGDFDPDRAMTDLGKAREDAKREKELRLKAEQDSQAKLDAVLIGLGLKPDPKTDPAATVAKVAKDLEDERARTRELATENAILKLAGKVGAKAEALQDSRSFMRELADLDPTDKGFDDAVATAMKAAIKANPSLAASGGTQGGQGPARQGADITGSGGGNRQRPAGLGAALAARMTSGR